jgi:probable phosphoglycerate mutase
LLTDGDVAPVAHGHLFRVLTARWLGSTRPTGGFFPKRSDASFLGTEHDEPVISAWNVPPR